MKRMYVTGGVDKGPYLGAPDFWIFGDGIMPPCVSEKTYLYITIRCTFLFRDQEHPFTHGVRWVQRLERHQGIRKRTGIFAGQWFRHFEKHDIVGRHLSAHGVWWPERRSRLKNIGPRSQ